MKVAIDAVCAENRSGTGRYASELLRAFRGLDVDVEFAVRLMEGSPLIDFLSSDSRFEVTVERGESRFGRVLMQNWRLNRWVGESGADVFHGPSFYLPGGLGVPGVVTVHDLVFALFPETVPFLRRQYYRRAFGGSIERADMILCDSESTRGDVMERYGVCGEGLRRVYLGVEERFFEGCGVGDLRAVRLKYGLPERFFLTLGTIEPRKNLERVLVAYRDACRVSSEVPALVVGGRLGWGVGGVRRLLGCDELRGRVFLAGFIDDVDLPCVYGLADLFLHVSLYEGFGLPLLEAMACGTAVLAGDNSSQREIVVDGDARVDAESVDGISGALVELSSRGDWLAEQGRLNRVLARGFTWEATARESLSAYVDCVESVKH